MVYLAARLNSAAVDDSKASKLDEEDDDDGAGSRSRASTHSGASQAHSSESDSEEEEDGTRSVGCISNITVTTATVISRLCLFTRRFKLMASRHAGHDRLTAELNLSFMSLLHNIRLHNIHVHSKIQYKTRQS